MERFDIRDLSLASDPDEVIKWWYEGLEPEPELSVSEWADQHRVLSRKAASEPGQWRTSRTPYLKEIMDVLSVFHPSKKIVFMKGAQIGGALPLDTPLPTPKGWVSMKYVDVGDELFDENGKVCRVTFKSQVHYNNPCYKITFSDGTDIVTDHIHRWTVGTYKGCIKTLTTPEIFESYKVGTKGRNKYFIPVQKSLHTKEKNLPIDPYQLGVWLGDGNRHTGQLYLNKEDSKEILLNFNQLYEIRYDSDKCVNVLVEGFCALLSKNRILGQKRIPIEYLRASYDQRLALLQGLMDTDGSINNNRCEFCTRDLMVYSGIYELLMSLGIKASVYHKKTDRGFGGKKIEPRDEWRVSFTVFDVEVFRLERKLSKMRKEGRVLETQKRFIVKVEKTNSTPTACIEVDSESHLYLCGRQMVPTHNTEAGNNWIGYLIDHAPGPIMAVQPTVDTAKRNSKLRIDPLIEESPRLAAKVKGAKSKDSSNTVLQKDFPGGTLVMTGANSAVGLRSMPARFLMLDEVDGYPKDLDGEGDPCTLALARSRTFSRRKAFFISTPTVEGESKIESEYEASDKRRFHVPCPHCEELQVLKFEQLQWPQDKPQEATYYCEHCGEEIPENQKTRMLSQGVWIAENPESDVVGFHINSLYSPVGWYSWKDIAQDFVDSKGDMEKMKTFVNTVLGETWKDKGDAPKWKDLYQRREEYKTGIIPKGGVFLTCGVDVQKNRLELEIVAWGRNKESWSVDYIVLQGDTTKSEVWEKLTSVINNTYENHKGQRIPIQLTAIDSGYNTQIVYNYCRKFKANRVIPIKGSKSLNMLIGRPKDVDVKYNGRTFRRGVSLWTVGVNNLKSELYGFLNQDVPIDDESFPIGYCHFPQYDSEYFQQLTAEEVRRKKDRRGYTTIEWVKTRERNEALDCRVYNRAAACIVGIDRFGEKDWNKLEGKAALVKSIKKDDNKKEIPKTRKKRKRSKSSIW